MSAPTYTPNRAVVTAARLLGGMQNMADTLGVSGPTAYQWRSGQRPVPPHRAAQLQRLTGGKVRADELNREFDFEALKV